MGSPEQNIAPKPEPRTEPTVRPLGQFLEAATFLDKLAQKESLTDEERGVMKQVERKLRNCCGQYAIATVCQMYDIPVSLRDAIDKTNPLGIFTGPLEIASFLKKQGLQTCSFNNASLDDLERHVKTGRPAILLVNADADKGGIGPHWIVVADVRRDAQGTRQWTISDAANMAGTNNCVGELSESALAQSWKHPLGRALSTGNYHNYFIAVDVQPNLVRIPSSCVVATGGAHIVNQLAKATAKSLEISSDLRARVVDLTAPEQQYRTATLPERAVVK
ncbi:MAG: hypothetical protein U0136_19360 [Bdellovibrionota bacterium]